MCKIKIVKGEGFDGLKSLLRKYKDVYMVFDRNVGSYAGEIERLNSRKIVSSLAIETSEQEKSLGTVIKIASWLLEQGADRGSLVLAVGGGITTDVVGFTASIYRRGVAYANVPTTLMAQVDAAIGGKTGVNFESYKNMLGVIRQPVFTYICTRTLETLDKKEFTSGVAELLKTFIIFDAEAYERTLTALKASYSEQLPSLIMLAAKYKSRIVRWDPYEKCRRRILNLGHTYGHAIEWYQQKYHITDGFTHGEAVALGIICAAKISEDKGIAKPGLTEKLIGDFTSVGLPVEYNYPEDVLKEGMKKDKKVIGGKLNIVLIKKIGKVKIRKI